MRSTSPSFATDLSVVEFKQGDLQSSRMSRPIDNQDEEIWQALVLGVRDYAHKCGFSKVILGLSGGIDSALVAAIAADALGSEQVLGVLMPSPYSSDHSISDAIDLSHNLGIQTSQLPIQELMTGFDHTLAPLFADTEFGIAEENIQSRIRGNLLMAIANKFGHLLLSTGNKSEMAVGYCTLYGDMNGGLAVIADVPKTRVYSLCRWLNRQQEIIPVNIIDKPPSAELKPGQMDQDSLPPYEILDDLLEKIICEHRSITELIARGFEPAVISQITKLLQRAEFKRRQAPPGLKITDRAFGTGWRMPIAALTPWNS
jgi:NAD+ synthase (glutamine-hydrolysing)